MMQHTTDIDRAVELGSNFFSDLLRAVRQHVWLIVGVAVTALLAAYVSVQFLNDEYESTARLLVKLGRENAEVPATVEKGGVLSTGVRKEDINSEIQMLSARSLIEATVDALGVQAFKLEPPPPRTTFQRIKAEARAVVRWFKTQLKETLITLNLRQRLSDREEAIVLLQKAMVVEREKDSDVIGVSVKLASPDLAMQVVDTQVQLYLNKRVELRRDPNLMGFFDEQLHTLKAQLDTLDATRLKVRDAGNISAMSEERVLLLRRMQTVYEDISESERELRLMNVRTQLAGNAPTLHKGESAASVPAMPLNPAAAVGAAAAAGSGTPLNANSQAVAAALPNPPSLGSYPNFQQMRDKLTDLRMRRTELLQRFSDTSEPVQRIDREVGQIETTLRQGLSSQLSELRSVSSSIGQRLIALNAGETTLGALERDRGALEQNYLSYAKRREEARIAEEMDIKRVSNIAVLNAAERPIQAVGPKKLLIVGLALPFGLLIGLGLSIFLEYLNQKVRDERDLLGLEGVNYLGPLKR